MFTTCQAIKEYALAGHATLTLTSEITGTHFTFKISQKKNENGNPRPMWFVGLLVGPDNTSDYSYLGMINMDNEGASTFRVTPGSKISPLALSARGFAFFWKYIAADTMPKDMKVQHEGSCGRCGRKLTVPESIERGIGPECASKMGFWT